MLEILAGVEACESDPFARLGPAVADELARVSTAIVVLLDWTESRRRLLEQITEAGCRLKTLLVVRDGEEPPAGAIEIPECTILSAADVARGGLEIR